LAIPVTPEEKEKRTAEKEKKAAEKAEKGEKEKDLAAVAEKNLSKVKDALRLGDDWFNQIKLNIKVRVDLYIIFL
jgi:hypothetical protein